MCCEIWSFAYDAKAVQGALQFGAKSAENLQVRKVKISQ